MAMPVYAPRRRYPQAGLREGAGGGEKLPQSTEENLKVPSHKQPPARSRFEGTTYLQDQPQRRHADIHEGPGTPVPRAAVGRRRRHHRGCQGQPPSTTRGAVGKRRGDARGARREGSGRRVHPRTLQYHGELHPRGHGQAPRRGRRRRRDGRREPGCIPRDVHGEEGGQGEPAGGARGALCPVHAVGGRAGGAGGGGRDGEPVQQGECDPRARAQEHAAPPGVHQVSQGCHQPQAHPQRVRPQGSCGEHPRQGQHGAAQRGPVALPHQRAGVQRALQVRGVPAHGGGLLREGGQGDGHGGSRGRRGQEGVRGGGAAAHQPFRGGGHHQALRQGGGEAGGCGGGQGCQEGRQERGQGRGRRGG
mmetsp:Transcript_43847/g.139735  ORF Transcript_43847/g.139735 Transcript_43847/m.139735 type:complete len:362 (-) Transcript_43847:356-1441(-)